MGLPEGTRVTYWKIIANNLSKAGWSRGCVSAVDSHGRAIFVPDAHRGGNQRFVVRAEEKLTAFTEAEAAVRAVSLERSSERASLGTNRSELRTDSVRLKLKQRYDLHSWTKRSRHDHESIICSTGGKTGQRKRSRQIPARRAGFGATRARNNRLVRHSTWFNHLRHLRCISG